MKKILIVGHGRCGKDTALEYLSKITSLRNAGTTSKYLTKYVAERLGVDEATAYEERHAKRVVWFNIGNEIRDGDPTKLIREALAYGELTGGVRDRAEIVAAKAEHVVDLIVWIQNDRVPLDPTVTFTEKDCDIVIQNNWGLDEFYERLERLAGFAGLRI